MKCSRLATGVWSANRGINTYASSNQKETFLDALASLDYKLSVSEWVIYRFQLAHLRVFQIIYAFW